MSSLARRFGWSIPVFVSLAVLSGAGCGPAVTQSPTATAPPGATTPADEQKAIAEVLDDWHAAAARADEERYFGHLAEGAVFLGTDATERWDKKAFRAYAHPHFFNGKAWSFHATRRAVVLAPGGQSAWFDEDLATEKLGPARGSGALVKGEDGWKITLYNLSIPIPNERFEAVKKLIAEGDSPAPDSPPAPGLAEACQSAAPGTVCGIVAFTGTPPVMKEPRQRPDAEFCKLEHVVHDSVLVHQGRLQDVVIRVVSGLPADPKAASFKGSIDVHQRKCNFAPRVATALVGQKIRFLNDDPTLHNVHAYDPSGATWFNQAQPKGAAPIEKDLDDAGIVRLMDDVYPWKTGFVVVSESRYITLTPESGVFTIQGLPDGKYGIEAWHSIYGAKRAVVTVKHDEVTTTSFSYSGKEPFAPENNRAAADAQSYP